MAHLDPASPIIFALLAVFFMAIVGSWIANFFAQSAVLGELLVGALFANLGYYFSIPLAVFLREGPALDQISAKLLSGSALPDAVYSVVASPKQAHLMLALLSGAHGADWMRIINVINSLSQFGLIFLLFVIGLDSSLAELKKTGRYAIQVAIIGVVAPIILGFGVSYYVLPDLSFNADLFIAATLCATSIGITARTLRDLNLLETREAKTILGAAIFDDVLGLLILALVSSIVIQAQINFWILGETVFLVFAFFFSIILLGPLLLKYLIQFTGLAKPNDWILAASFVFLMFLSWLASLVQLACIMGAFLAGMILDDRFFKSKKGQNKPSIKSLLSPFEVVFAPLFFILMGMQIKFELIFQAQVLYLSLGLILAAFLGKLLAGLGASKEEDRLMVGIGMLPRGEVGLVFAAAGQALSLIDDALYAAIILMIIVTTFLAPLLLKWRVVAQSRRAS